MSLALMLNADESSDTSPDASDSSYRARDDPDCFSLTPSITDYPIRWGRRYHKFKEGKYLLPNDELEANRLELQHTVITNLHGGRLFFSPLTNPDTILDIGTGTGSWPIQLADSGIAPNARITGTDLSPIQPDEVPENVIFEVADCTEDDWCRPESSIDLIHVRMMLSSLQSYPLLMRRAKRYLKPGSGWLELHEIDPTSRTDDNTIPEKWPLREWERKMAKAVKRTDRSKSLGLVPRLKAMMVEEGFVDVEERICKIPIGNWPKHKTLKECGRLFAESVHMGIGGMSYMILGDGLDMSREEIEVLLADVRKGLSARGIHAYYHLHTVFGRRPSKG